MSFDAVFSQVANRGKPSREFIEELVRWAKGARDEIFAPRKDPRPPNKDIYTLVRPTLGPWDGLNHRKAAMLEVLRVLAGLESSWDWNEGVDTTNARSMRNVTGQETGAWQVSYDSLPFGDDLRALSERVCQPLSPRHFIDKMKSNRAFAMEYIARLLRHTHRHNGPVLRGEIVPYLKRSAVAEFEAALSA